MDPYADQPSEFDASYALPIPMRSDFHNPHDDPIQFPTSLINPSLPTGSRRSDPASPKDLARRLAELSPRHSPVLAPQYDAPAPAALDLSPPLVASDSSDAGTASTDALGLIAGDQVPQLVGGIEVGDPGEEALMQSITGLYAMWRLNRSSRGAAEQDDRAAFMRVVESALA